MRNCRIADSANTYNYALTILQNKGYKVFLVPDRREEFTGNFWAIKDKRDFIASDPLRLLGLVSIWETFGDDWYEKSKGINNDPYDLLFRYSLPDSPEDFEDLSEQDYKNLVRDYQLLFEALGEEKIDDRISRKDFFDVVTNYYKKEE